MEQETPDSGTACTCVIRNAPSVATTSMMACVEHGETEDLAQYPGQGLFYSVMISKNEHYSLVGPLNTQEHVEAAKYYGDKLGYGIHGVYSMSSLGDLLALAEGQGLIQSQQPSPTQEKLPRSLVNVQRHEPGCIYAEQGHPGKCYISADPDVVERPYEALLWKSHTSFMRSTPANLGPS